MPPHAPDGAEPWRSEPLGPPARTLLEDPAGSSHGDVAGEHDDPAV